MSTFPARAVLRTDGEDVQYGIYQAYAIEGKLGEAPESLVELRNSIQENLVEAKVEEPEKASGRLPGASEDVEPSYSLSELQELQRPELEFLAEEAGVENPGSFRNKGSLAQAILEASS